MISPYIPEGDQEKMLKYHSLRFGKVISPTATEVIEIVGNSIHKFEYLEFGQLSGDRDLTAGFRKYVERETHYALVKIGWRWKNGRFEDLKHEDYQKAREEVLCALTENSHFKLSSRSRERWPNVEICDSLLYRVRESRLPDPRW